MLVCSVAGAALMAFYAPMLLASLFTGAARLLGAQGSDLRYNGDRTIWNIIPFSLMGLIVGAGAGAVLIRLGSRLDKHWDKMDSGDKVTLFVGIFAGLVASLPFLFLLNSLNLGIYIPVAVVGLTLGFAALSVYALQSMEEILPWTRGRTKARRQGIKILDTNVIIDGRIYDVARTGFLEGELYVPQFVLEELQFIADSPDALRRQRGRRGLDLLRLMKDDFQIQVGDYDRFAGQPGDEVDTRLVKLALNLGGDIVTNDFNLNRVAKLQNVRVLNINDLALGLRPNVLPSESLQVTVIREGNQPHQGVGYLEDGTMIVVENGRGYIGETVDVTVTQVIQTERGKMIFGELPNGNGRDFRK